MVKTRQWGLLLMLSVLSACVDIPKGVNAVQHVDIQRYLGTWYEIARLDNYFEKGLEQVTASYTLNEDGSLQVKNRGYNPVTQEWHDAEGEATPVRGAVEGRFKVTFFWPFYGAYNIIDLDDKGYQYSMVTGPDREWLWILSRSPHMDQRQLQALLAKAKTLGYDTEHLVFPRQSQ